MIPEIKHPLCYQLIFCFPSNEERLREFITNLAFRKQFALSSALRRFLTDVWTLGECEKN